MKKRFLIANLVWTLALMPGRTALAGDPEILAILSSDSLPYQEALKGLEHTLGHPVPRIILTGDELPPLGTSKIIVAIGGRAASRAYPTHLTLIYCLAPGIILHAHPDWGRRIKVPVCSLPEVMILRMKKMQPGLKRLAIFRISANFADHVKALRQDALRQGIDVIEEELKNGNELPERLRALKGKADALWLAPDPLLITPSNFAMVKEFARSNHMPLYVPMDNLVDQGATASIVPSFQDMGAAAARLAQAALAGTLPADDTVYSDQVHLTLNLSAAAQSGLVLPADVIKTAERIVE